MLASIYNPLLKNPLLKKVEQKLLIRKQNLLTPFLIQYALFRGRNDWIGTVTLRIFDAKRCKKKPKKNNFPQFLLHFS
jgi:hypothetical protein